MWMSWLWYEGGHQAAAKDESSAALQDAAEEAARRERALEAVCAATEYAREEAERRADSTTADLVGPCKKCSKRPSTPLATHVS